MDFKAFTFLLMLVVLASSSVSATDVPETSTSETGTTYYALIISGVAGDLKHSEKFQRLTKDLYETLIADFGYEKENIVYLAADARKTDTHVTDTSTKANISLAIEGLKKKAGPEDQTLVVVIGHADCRDGEAYIHLPRRDMNPEDFGKMFEDYPGKLVIAVTTPVSGMFMDALSGKNRVVITATKADMEINETYFPEAMLDAISKIKHSKDTGATLADIFMSATELTQEYFKTRLMIQTEHPMLDDNGDGKGTRELTEDAEDGSLARSLVLGPLVAQEGGEDTTDAGVLEAGTRWERLRPPAVVLLHDIEYAVHSDLTYRIKERKQIKILNKGGHQFSDVIISYNNAYETLSIESARTIKANGEIDELNPNEILDAKAIQSMMYTESRYKRFSMPSIEDGCVIDYTFVKTGKNLHLSKDFWRTFVIEKPIPQDELRITFSIPKTKKISYRFTREDLPFKLEKSEDEDKFSNTFVFVMKEIPPLNPEGSSPPVQELSTRLTVTSLESWDTVWDWYKKLADGARDSSEELDAIVAEITKDKSSDVEKARAVYDWVCKNIRYVGLELGKHGYQPHTATSIFDNKFGDCKDKATLLLSMLDEAGVEGGSIVLIPTNIMAQVDSSTPTLDQFNHAIATIIIDGKRYWLDTTGGETSFGDIPVSDQNRKVFVIGEDKGEFMTIPIQGPEDNLLDNKSEMTLDADGSIRADEEITYTGAFAEGFRHRYKYESVAAQEQALESVLSKFVTGAHLERQTIEGLDTLADRIVYKRQYRSRKYAPVADDLIIINVPLQRIGMTELVSTKGRRHPLVIGQTMARKGEVDLNIPDGYRVRNVPKPVKLERDYGTYEETYEFDEESHKLICRNSFVLNEVEISAGEYADFKDFIEGISEAQRSLVILIKDE